MGVNAGTRKQFGLAIVVVVLCFLLIAGAIPANAKQSEVRKNTKTHDIAIVYDTSGSMYKEGTQGDDAWCQALYAMEVFAAMLDYDNGDRLGIYPMGPISITKEGQTISDRLDINSKDDVQKLEQIYVEKSSETIFEPVYKARDYLATSNADEKWLIVLTDGEFIYEKYEDIPKKKKIPNDQRLPWTEKTLREVAKKANGDIKVQYLGFANAFDLQSDEANWFYAKKAADAGDLTNKLVDICNQIFQRDLIKKILNGHFPIDVSMNSIIAFAQGSHAEIRGLKNEKGVSVKETNDTKLQANRLGAGNQPQQKMADISGQVVTYDSCKAGEYTLSYSGNNVQVFYEPNVEVAVRLKDQSGKIVDTKESLLPGDYILEYGLVDGETGEDVSGSELLKPVDMEDAVVKNNGKEYRVASGGTITLDADADTTISVKGKFLNRYEIEATDGSESGGISISVKPPKEKELSTKFISGQEHNWYMLKEHDKWQPILLEVRYDGKKLSDEEMTALKTKFTPKPTKEFSYSCSVMPGESAFRILVGTDQNGKYVEPKTGSYCLDTEVVYTDEYGRKISAADGITLDIQRYPWILHFLKGILILAAIVLAVLFILTRKAYPNRLTLVIDGGGRKLIKIKPTGTRIVPGIDYISCSTKKDSMLMHRYSKKASISVDHFTASDVFEFTLNGTLYEANEGFEGPPNNILEGSLVTVTYSDGQLLTGHYKMN